LRGDITTLALYNDLGPHLWADLAALSDLTDLQKERERIDDACGYEAGVSLAFRFAGNNGIAGIGLASRHMDPAEFESRWQSHAGELMMILAEFDALMRPAMVAARLRLTPREKQCLKLAIGGMSAKEIGHHLGIGERSVFNIQNRARKSLEAATTIEAVAKALAYDLI
jgi:DNA-binding CsgD family transcriptional regulator